MASIEKNGKKASAVGVPEVYPAPKAKPGPKKKAKE